MKMTLSSLVMELEQWRANLSIVKWHYIVLASICFAMWAFIHKESRLRWPLAPAIYVITQCALALPIFMYYVGKQSVASGAVGTVLCVSFLCFLYIWGKEMEPTVFIGWTMLAGAVGLLGFFSITYELQRLGDMSGGMKVFGITLATTFVIEAAVGILYSRLIEKHAEPVVMSGFNWACFFGLIICIFGLFKQKHPNKIVVGHQAAQVGALAVAEEKLSASMP